MSTRKEMTTLQAVAIAVGAIDYTMKQIIQHKGHVEGRKAILGLLDAGRHLAALAEAMHQGKNEPKQ